MALNIFNPGVNTSFTSELNSNFNNGYRLPLLNVVSQLEDRSVTISADGGLFAEAYVDADGRLNSVDTASSTAIFDTDKYIPTSTAYDLNNIVLTKNLDVSEHTSNPRGICFGDGGTYLYFIGSDTNEVHQYTMSASYDISTATYTRSFSLTTEIPTSDYAYGIYVSPSGNYFYTLKFSSNFIYQYTMSTPFDLSTATYTRNNTLNIPYNTDLIFNNDGTKLFVCSTSTDRLYEYALSTAYDISTRSYTRFIYLTSYTYDVSGVAFNNDGSSLFVTDKTANKIVEFTLTTPYDLSTSTYANVKTLNEVPSDPRGISFNDNGSSMFITDDSTYTGIVQYSFFSGTIVHNIPTGTFSDTFKNGFATALVSDREEGDNIQYKLTNATEDTGYGDFNEILESATAFTSEPTKLIVKLINNNDSPTDGYPSIKGVAMIGDY